MATLTEIAAGDIAKNLAPSELISKSDAQRAMNVLQSNGLPTTRFEAWKYTRVAKLGKVDFKNQKGGLSDLTPYLIDPETVSLIFINGHYHSTINDIPAGVSFSIFTSDNKCPEAVTPIDGEVFTALNTGYLNGGVKINIARNAHIEKPVQIIHIAKDDEQISNFRMIVNAEESSKASLIQGFFTDGNSSFTNVISEIFVHKNANISLNKLQNEAEDCFHIATDTIIQKRDSLFTINTMTLNGGLVRNNLNIQVLGENCITNLNGAYVLKNKQHVDNHTIVDHKVPHCESHELYKGVIDEKATAVFNGKVFVRQDAQKINAFQSNANVLLSDDGTVNSKPELEIYADDVKCSHGSTTGQLDEQAIFYLRARGISEKNAKQLMIAAFIEDVLEKIENESFLNFIHTILQERYGWQVNR